MPKSKKLKNWSIIFTGGVVAVALSLCIFTHSARAAGRNPDGPQSTATPGRSLSS